MDCKWTFLSADVELTNHCAENCAMCPREQLRRPQGFMSREVFSRVLEVLGQFNSRVTFSGLGNPALHPFWADCVHRTRAAGLPAGLVLHPSALSPGTLRLLAEHPPSHLEISFPSVDPALFSRLCPNADFAESVQRIVQLRRQYAGQMVCVGLQLPGSPSARQYRSFWRVHGVGSRFFPCHSRGGKLRNRSLVTATPPRSISCGLLALHAFITWDGDLLACCHDLTGETRFGNICHDDPLLLARQKAQFAAAGPPWGLCRDCDEFRRGWPLPEGDCPWDPALRARQLRLKTRGR